jgi:hypothetical protein
VLYIIYTYWPSSLFNSYLSGHRFLVNSNLPLISPEEKETWTIYIKAVASHLKFLEWSYYNVMKLKKATAVRSHGKVEIPDLQYPPRIEETIQAIFIAVEMCEGWASAPVRCRWGCQRRWWWWTKSDDRDLNKLEVLALDKMPRQNKVWNTTYEQ